MEKITFMPEGGEAAVDFYVLEQTAIGGVSYILVTDAEEEEMVIADCIRWVRAYP